MKKLLLVLFLTLVGAVMILPAAPLTDNDPSSDDCTLEMVLLDLDLDFDGINPWRNYPPFEDSNPYDLDRSTVLTILEGTAPKFGLSTDDMCTVYRDGNLIIEVTGAGKFRVTTSGGTFELFDSSL